MTDERYINEMIKAIEDRRTDIERMNYMLDAIGFDTTGHRYQHRLSTIYYSLEEIRVELLKQCPE